MTVKMIMIEKPFFHADAGSTLLFVENSRMLQVCDVCGEKRYCDWYEWDPPIRGMTGMDVCRSCAKRLAWREKL